MLFQLGGPDSPEAIEPFLYNLFSDPDIIDFPFARLARPALARLIAARRAKHVREHYARIGGRSPIRELTERQAAALERELRRTIDARCLVAMRYWNPSTADAVRQIQARRFDRLVLLPLYPQYSKTTTGSSLNEWRRQYNATARDLGEARVIPEFYNHSFYIEAVVEKITLDQAGGDQHGQIRSQAAQQRREHEEHHATAVGPLAADPVGHAAAEEQQSGEH